MIRFLSRNTLPILTLLGVGVAVFVALRWPQMPVMQRVTSLFFVALIAHVWEETRFPGGFTQLVTDKLGFTASNPQFGELVTAVYVLGIAFVPILFPHVPFLAGAALLLGFLEALAHTAAIRMFRLERPYSPGMITAVFVLLPISLWGAIYASRHHLVIGWAWLFAVLYVVATLLVAQQIVVRAGGMRYADFLRNVRAAIFGVR